MAGAGVSTPRSPATRDTQAQMRWWVQPLRQDAASPTMASVNLQSERHAAVAQDSAKSLERGDSAAGHGRSARGTLLARAGKCQSSRPTLTLQVPKLSWKANNAKTIRALRSASISSEDDRAPHLAIRHTAHDREYPRWVSGIRASAAAPSEVVSNLRADCDLEQRRAGTRQEDLPRRCSRRPPGTRSSPDEGSNCATPTQRRAKNGWMFPKFQRRFNNAWSVTRVFQKRWKSCSFHTLARL